MADPEIGVATESHGARPRRLADVRVRMQTGALLVVRGAALFLAAFTAIGLVGELRGRTLDVSLWWVDLHDLPSMARIGLLATLAALLAAWALRPASGGRRRWATAAICVVFAGFAARDVVGFYAAVGAGEVRPFVDVPMSLFVALWLVGLAVLAARVERGRPVGGRRGLVAVVGAAGASAVVFALAQMLFFGTTDYRRPADAAVIFGAQVYATGRPSPLLADRIATGIELYRAGLVPLLVMSGGDGADGFNEADVMRDVAIAAGVDPAAIIVDPAGDSTEATVANVSALLRARSGAARTWRLIAVSQAYHLPRVQLAFANAGIDVLTVPSVDPAPIGPMPLLIAREVVAFWAYDLRVCLG